MMTDNPNNFRRCEYPEKHCANCDWFITYTGDESGIRWADYPDGAWGCYKKCAPYKIMNGADFPQDDNVCDSFEMWGRGKD